ncbi:hypothetical protein KIN20_013095 [Parelaphostrongylus tenuis]|uniref:Uncharacterized protein n=1 Tax=Parelaphostrongylus tenuis TaxID=148309 RepID=A0AAD5MVN4_PARTN|nr:hypothetical protein KIN20_013095 [Parelaphostrongylus tenuis]
MILQLTPGDSKCRLYCKGSTCLYCNVFHGESAIPRLHSTWITENIVAMARPQAVHFENDEIILMFKRNNIRAVFNLQEAGEHSFCGEGNLTSGFSYDPDHLMKNEIFYYNFPLHDFEACTAERLIDIVTVMADELTRGKVAVHCHAGHGRTGMVIAACLMLVQGVTPEQAVHLVRQKRANSVQSPTQVHALHELHSLIRRNALVLPKSPFLSTSLYTEFTSKVLPKIDARRYGKVPKPIYLGFMALLHKFFSSVDLTIGSAKENPCRFRFVCSHPTSFVVTEEMLHQIGVDSFARGRKFYMKCTENGMNITNLERFLMNDVDIVDLVSFIDYFIRTAFFQMTNSEEVLLFLRSIESNAVGVLKDWSWSLCFVLSAMCCIPECTYSQLTPLVAKWFTRGDHRVADAIHMWLVRWRRRREERNAIEK